MGGRQPTAHSCCSPPDPMSQSCGLPSTLHTSHGSLTSRLLFSSRSVHFCSHAQLRMLLQWPVCPVRLLILVAASESGGLAGQRQLANALTSDLPGAWQSSEGTHSTIEDYLPPLLHRRRWSRIQCIFRLATKQAALLTTNLQNRRVVMLDQYVNFVKGKPQPLMLPCPQVLQRPGLPLARACCRLGVRCRAA